MTFRLADDGRRGAPSLGIAEEELAAVVRLIVVAARRTRIKDLPGDPEALENRLSVFLHQNLIDLQRRARIESLEFFLEASINLPEYKRGKVAGRIDLKVKFPHQWGRYESYFGVECKRLAPGQNALSRYYMTAGIGKFIDGTYSRGHPAGMLVAYVLGPTLEDCSREVAERVAAGHPRAGKLVDWAPPVHDAVVLEGGMPRRVGDDMRLLHTFVRMYG
ncbi:hypothetical protein D3273_01165 [Lichenibacterium minor]|uniref:Uncharacterized protein n=1 Tax=Lichenibacterium minor TaxID=2316528 RepID=A0A4Q2UF01_9HYPH|nr:hypothetical protein [Lichenibacterium minor]RYC33891.1 hypothetical protein D3273_01165 [Lichenibacterium minor]